MTTTESAAPSSTERTPSRATERHPEHCRPGHPAARHRAGRPGPGRGSAARRVPPRRRRTGPRAPVPLRAVRGVPRLRPARPHGPPRTRGLRRDLRGSDEGRDRHLGGRLQHRPDVPAAHRGHPAAAGVRLARRAGQVAAPVRERRAVDHQRVLRGRHQERERLQHDRHPGRRGLAAERPQVLLHRQPGRGPHLRPVPHRGLRRGPGVLHADRCRRGDDPRRLERVRPADHGQRHDRVRQRVDPRRADASAARTPRAAEAGTSPP